MKALRTKYQQFTVSISLILILILLGILTLIYFRNIGAARETISHIAIKNGFEVLCQETKLAMKCYEEEMQEKEILAEAERIASESKRILNDWQSIPAGTVLDNKYIDYEQTNRYFAAYEIPDEVFAFINGKSYQENPDVSLEDLRYLKVLHYNFNHELQVGELIVAKDLQEDFIGIFRELYDAEYEIQSLYLVDNYWTGDPTDTDTASIDVNNSSCFMYRPVTGGSKLSMHSYGRAIDINPQQNPYVSYRTGSPVWDHENANDYIDRTTGLPHVITEEDVCYKIFMKYGFEWGGSWEYIKDYQHFEK